MTSPAPNVTVIGHSFIQAYYNALSCETENCFKFYNNHSQLSHSEDVTYGNLADIKNYYSNLCNLAGASVNLERGSFDIQSCGESCVLICITGHLSLSNESVMKPFVHTFVLARDPTTLKQKRQGYFVQNEVLRLIDASSDPRDSSVSADEVVVDGAEKLEEKESTAPVEEQVDTSDDESIGHGAGEEKESMPSEEEQEMEEKEEIQNEKVNEDVATIAAKTATSLVLEPKSPTTWASLLSSSSTNAPVVPTLPTNTNSVAKSTTSKPKEVTVSEKDSSNDAPASSAASNQREQRGGAGYGGCSFYVRDVTREVDEDGLRQVFEKYGFAIHKINCVPARGFAFIDFSDPNAADSIVAENGGKNIFTLPNGKQIHADKKVTKNNRYRRPSPRGSGKRDGGGGRGRGRGGGRG
jgi:hypothetical protein